MAHVAVPCLRDPPFLRWVVAPLGGGHPWVSLRSTPPGLVGKAPSSSSSSSGCPNALSSLGMARGRRGMPGGLWERPSLRLRGSSGGARSPPGWRPPTQPLARPKLPPRRRCPSPEEERRPEGEQEGLQVGSGPSASSPAAFGEAEGADGGRSPEERRAWRWGPPRFASSVRGRHMAAPQPSLLGSPGEASGENVGLLLVIRGHLLTLSIRVIKGCIFCGKIQHQEHASLNMEIQNFISNLLDLN